MNQDSPFGNLQGSFGQSTPPDSAGGTNYAHPQEDKVRQQLYDALSQSTTGNALLQFAGQQQVLTKIIRGKDRSGFIPEARTIYISLSPDLSTVSSIGILEYAAYLKQAKTHFSGQKNPELSMTSDESLKVFDIKMVDSLAVMCKIATELMNSGHAEFVDALNATGHSELYEAYGKYGMSKEFIEAYFKAVKAK